jgi:7-cyano-7-deazaguanine synthase
MIQAIILLSGGVDSCVVLAQALSSQRSCIALSFDYEQRHRIELNSAKAIAAHYGILHRILRIDPALFVGASSALVNPYLPVTTNTPSTYVPCRNLLFLAHAASFAESIGASEIWVGANANDVPTYPDCAPSFFKAFENAAATGSYLGAGGLRVVSPLAHLSKQEVFTTGRQLDAPLDLSWSCYDPQDNKPCTVCPACILRAKSLLPK